MVCYGNSSLSSCCNGDIMSKDEFREDLSELLKTSWYAGYEGFEVDNWRVVQKRDAFITKWSTDRKPTDKLNLSDSQKLKVMTSLIEMGLDPDDILNVMRELE